MRRSRFDIRAQPGFGFITLFTFFALYLPIAALVAYAFNANESLAVWGGFSTRWYASLFQNEQLLEAIWTTFRIGLITATAGRIWVENKVDFSETKNLITTAAAVIAGAGDLTLNFGGFTLGGIGTATFGAILLYALLDRKPAKA